MQAGIRPAEFWDLTPDELQLHLDALGERLEREQRTMRAHAYIVSRLVWATDPPLFEEFVLGEQPDVYLTPEERTEQDVRLWDGWLARSGAGPAAEA